MKTSDEKLRVVRPRLEDLLPRDEDQLAFQQATAAIEAGRLVRGLREHAGLKQAELAERLRVSQARLSAVERGNGRDGPSYTLLKRIAAACGVDWPGTKLIQKYLPDVASVGRGQAARVDPRLAEASALRAATASARPKAVSTNPASAAKAAASAGVSKRTTQKARAGIARAAARRASTLG